LPKSRKIAEVSSEWRPVAGASGAGAGSSGTTDIAALQAETDKAVKIPQNIEKIDKNYLHASQKIFAAVWIGRRIPISATEF
jgi:hypothetical protein